MTIRLDVWTDIACPFCFIGSTQLTKAIDAFEHGTEVEVVDHAFQLDPNSPTHTHESSAEMLARKFNVPVEQAQQMLDGTAARAAAEGLNFDMERNVPVNTFDAHRLIQFAATHGKRHQTLLRLYAAYFTNGESVADHATLKSIAAEVGLPADEVSSMLETDAFAAEVHADIQQAAAYGINGVPFVVINNKYGISGAQGSEAFADALNTVWAETHA